MKLKKFKRIFISTMVAGLALSIIAAFAVSAKTDNWTHTVSVPGIPGRADSIDLTLNRATTKLYDTFSSYPTIFDNYQTSRNKARAYNQTKKIDYGYKFFTLTKDSAAYEVVNYGNSLQQGSYFIQYVNVSQSGFRDTAVLSQKY